MFKTLAALKDLTKIDKTKTFKMIDLFSKYFCTLKENED